MINPKHLFGLLAAAQSTVNLSLYLRSVLQGKTKPHMFTWLLWSGVIGIVFVIQLTHGAGSGSWQTACSATLCGIVGLVALRRGDCEITKSDWAALIGGLMVIPLWLLTKDPFLSVVLLTTIDCVGFYPTFRKSWNAPRYENVYRPFRSAIMWATSILALEQYNQTVLFYPVVMVFMELSLGLTLVWRRKIVQK